MAEQKKMKQEIPVMRGNFQIRGVVRNFDKTEGFEKITSNGKKMRKIVFDVESNEGNVHRMQIQAFSSDKVYFSGKVTENGQERNVVEEVAWNNRNIYKKEGFAPIDRLHYGLEKVMDENGKEKNKTNIMLTYDAIENVYNLLKVGDSILIRGSIQVEEYTNKQGEKANATKFVPNQIYLTATPIDFKAEDFKEMACFDLQAIAEEIEIKGTEEAEITALVIGNKKIGRQTLVFKKDASLGEDFDVAMWVNICRNFQNSPKKYICASFCGNIVNTVEEVSNTVTYDEWGIPSNVTSPLRRTANGYVREFICSGVVSGTIDNDTYTPENVEQFINTFIKPKEEFAETKSVDGFYF